MKQALVLIILITLFQSDVFGQKFTPSETLTLSKSNEPLEIDLNKEGANKQTIFLQKENKKLKDFPIRTEEYAEEYSSIEEINNTELENIDKIVKVNIEHCGCYCNTDIYYWLITKDNKWIELPKIEQYIYDIGNTYTEYIFRKGNKNIIEIVEFREKMTNKPNKNNPAGFDIERFYEKKIDALIWNGKILKRS